MWPKALAQLIELAPHVSRLVPLADRFFQNKSATEDSNRRAMEAMAEGLRGDLGQVTNAHAGLYKQLSEQSEQILALTKQVRTLAAAAEAAETRASRLSRRMNTVAALLLLILLLAIAILVVLIVLFAHHR